MNDTSSKEIADTLLRRIADAVKEGYGSVSNVIEEYKSFLSAESLRRDLEQPFYSHTATATEINSQIVRIPYALAEAMTVSFAGRMLMLPAKDGMYEMGIWHHDSKQYQFTRAWFVASSKNWYPSEDSPNKIGNENIIDFQGRIWTIFQVNA